LGTSDIIVERMEEAESIDDLERGIGRTFVEEDREK
jgi:hypothetical protein